MACYIQLNRKQKSAAKGIYALIDEDDYEWLSQYNWSFFNGYASRYEGGKVILMHREINKTPDGYDTDHINHHRLDNRKCNLRTTTHAANILNSQVRKDNTTGRKGVQAYPGGFRGSITVNGIRYRKKFKILKDAIAWRTDMETKMLANIYDS